MKNIEKIKEILKKSKKIAFFHHINPDGDAIASSYALMRAIKENYPEKKVAFLGDIQSIKNKFDFLKIDYSDFAKSINADEDWTVCVGDTPSKSRIYLYDEYKKGKIKVCFDHHINPIDFQVDYAWQDANLNASAIQAWHLAKSLCARFDAQDVLIFLFGIITDTGWYAYSLNKKEPHLAALEIFQHTKPEFVGKLFNDMRTQTYASLKLDKWVLNNYIIKSKVAYCVIKESDLRELNISADEFLNIHRISNIEGTKAWAFFIEDVANDVFKISLRSNGISVNKFATKYGGGGHERASGIKMKRDWANLNLVIDDFLAYVK